MKNLSDLEIIESVKRGNEGDYSLIVDRYKNRAFSLLRRMLKNEMDAEEALQDSFLKAYNSLSSFRADAKFSTWFYRIVYNTALTMIASKKRQIEKEMTSIEDHFDLGAFDNKIYAETDNAKEYLLKMVDRLPIRYALVLILFYIDNMSLNEISQVMDVSLVNVKVLLHRSRNALRDLLLKHNYQEELR
ncbi:MAG: sigma-70 family RNA polymerase sigma factor [Melioribacteraceae bacterium]|nr:sigma-70 family RNA polymerase sigma factor [Melioribacteraceae bacterium]MCF8356375.1 sigma-70 family RNA polymerase sigma factor [Melioribacteraceae bacterium]MCF8395758.1 sigma-70 family RNA polymerase sigma factor [Melioribacteraceae bacterium]MCF8420899.1 sigma-70 family RNA polymerase sigma factor [Melioribacteraceae bacterium]